jgi:spore photoproduct lyase
MWTPGEIIIHEAVRHDPVTEHVVRQCPQAAVKITGNSRSAAVVEASDILKNSGSSMLEKILAGKRVLFIAPAGTAVDAFTMPDDRMVCPQFDRLKLASNGCFYACDWCYLKLTYRASFPFITVRAQYDRIKAQLEKRLSRSPADVIFNCGELADSLAMEHLTGAAREFIPWFGRAQNGYLYMLTKSDQVEEILDLPHNGHTILTWSMNEPSVSQTFEIGAPTFDRRLSAALKAREAGYRVRIRLDPVVPVDGWQKAYAETIERIFNVISPERVTIGTLRFEEGFYRMRRSIFTTGPALPGLMEGMEPMFDSKLIEGSLKRGKYSFNQGLRAEIFRFVVEEIRRHSTCQVALCKESADVWRLAGLDPSPCACSCQL